MRCFKLSCKIVALLSLLWLSGCTSFAVDTSKPVKVPPNKHVAVLPFINHTQTPRAGLQAKTLATQLLHKNYQGRLSVYTLKEDCDKLVQCPPRELPMHKIRHWANRNHVQYAFTGSVNEYRYKTGLEGRPAANMTLSLIQFPQGKIIWRGVGSANGSYYDSLGNISQGLMDRLIQRAIH